MIKRLRTLPLVAIFLVAWLSAVPPVLAAGNWGAQSASKTGFAATTALSGGVTSSAINMGKGQATTYFSKVTLLMTIIWGGTVLLDITGEYSWNGTDFFTIMRCTSATTHICDPRKWQFDPTDGTTLSLGYPTNAPYLRFTFDDPGTDTGTIIVSVIKGF